MKKMNYRKNKKGIALLIVMTSVVVITVLVVELNYNARVSMTLAGNYKDDLRAYYLARSSVNIALLRLAILKKIDNINISGFKVPNSVLELIWSLPFFFPPSEALFATSSIDDEADIGAKELINEIREKMNISGVGSFQHSISGLDSKLNLNILVQNEEGIQRFKEVMNVHYSNELKNNEDFARTIPIEDFDEVLNNIIDWIDFDRESRNGGDENSYYQKYDPPYKAKNSYMHSLSELNLVAGMTDELFEFISPLLTVYSSGLININIVEKEVLYVIDNRLTEDEIKLFYERLTTEGYFENETELRTWIGQNTSITSTNFNPLNIPLSFSEKNFKIEAMGISGKVVNKITCYVSESYETLLKGVDTSKNKKNAIISVKPNIIHWEIN